MKYLLFVILFNSLIVSSGNCNNELFLSEKSKVSLPCNRPYSLLRFGIGVQRSFYTELGITRYKHLNLFHHSAKYAFYGALKWIPALPKGGERNIGGLKAGTQLYLNRFILEFEPVFLTDGINNNMLITPKIGVNIAGSFNLCYGYNITLLGKSFSKIGYNQFSLVFNFSSRIFNKR